MAGEIDKMLEQTNREIEQSKKLLQELANEVVTLADIVQPALDKQIQALRSARMSTVLEIRESLSALRDIRKFFLEEDYEREMGRLERFVGVCRELQKLKREGVLDSVAETAIRMGLQEKQTV